MADEKGAGGKGNAKAGNDPPPGGAQKHMRFWQRATVLAYYLALAALAVVGLFALWPASDVRAAVEANPERPVNLTLSLAPLGGGTTPVSYDQMLLALALLAGAMGSVVHGITSLARYRGAQKLYEHWFIWYLSLPPVGALLSVAMYGLLTGGLLVLSGGAIPNPPTILAVGFLSGMFSKSLIPKLGEVFNEMFKTRETLPDELGRVPAVTGFTPGAVADGLQEVVLKGRGLQTGFLLDVGGQTFPIEATGPDSAKARVPPQLLAAARELRVDSPSQKGTPYLVHTVETPVRSAADEVAELRRRLDEQAAETKRLREELAKRPPPSA